jgi:hypothetical protein
MKCRRTWLVVGKRLMPSITLAWAVVAAIGAKPAQSATVEYILAIDSLPGHTGCVSCTLSGSGTWDLYARTSFGDNFGIASYKVSLLNTTSILHRSPRARLSPDPAGIDPDQEPAGFTLLRTANNVNPIHASQDTVSPTPYLVKRFGQMAGSFASLFPTTNEFLQTNQTTWGSAILIAEGTYSGVVPTFNFADPSAANIFTELGGRAAAAASILGQTCMFDCSPVRGILNDFSHVAALNEVVATQINGTPGAHLFSGLRNFSYTQMFGAPAAAPGLNLPPAWNPATQQFSWDTRGSSRGRYTWEVDAAIGFGGDTARITIDVPFVPEPSSLALLCVMTVSISGRCRVQCCG